MTACSEITQSPDGNRASGRRPRSMTTSTSSLTSGCRASPRLILAGTTSKNASSSSSPPPRRRCHRRRRRGTHPAAPRCARAVPGRPAHGRLRHRPARPPPAPCASCSAAHHTARRRGMPGGAGAAASAC